MSTFSLSPGITPGAPGVYINEQPGNIAFGGISDFSTVYMLVEAPEDASVTRFPFNTPIPVTSINDYKYLVGGFVPEDRIPLLSYNCVNEFFQNAQTGDLRVVRVGTPNSYAELQLLPSGSKQATAGLPTALEAGDVVYAQLILNGSRLVAGDGSTGYSSSGEWLGVPVTIPVDYISGDEANNRKIGLAVATAIAEAIESNPSIRSSVYVRDFGLVNNLDPTSNSENGYVLIAGTTFDAPVSVVTEVQPVGSISVFTQSTYDVNTVVGGQYNLVRVPQDYIQCINTAFDSQRDQGYLITPTAYAQFDAAGRAAVGAAAAVHCESNNFKWMALADPGPFLVTDVNKYSTYTPHEAADDLVNGNKYLVDNAIYEWTGADVSYDKLRHQVIIGGYSPETAISESQNNVVADAKVGLVDSGMYLATAGADAKINLDNENYWPVTLQIQEVTIEAGTGSFSAYDNQNLYVVAPPYDVVPSGDYPINAIYLAETPGDAVSVLNEVVAAGGTVQMGSAPVSALSFTALDTCTISYATPAYNLPQNINGQVSNLVQNITGTTQYVNTNHLPSTLQDPTESYRLGFVSRFVIDPSDVTFVTDSSGTANLYIENHGLQNGQKIYFTQAVTTASGTLFKATSKVAQNPYYVKVVDSDNIQLAASLSAYSAGSFVPYVAVTGSVPTVLYTATLGAEVGSVTNTELQTLGLMRARKYGFATGTIYGQAINFDEDPTSGASTGQDISFVLNNSATVLGKNLVSSFGEDTTADWLPSFQLIPAGAPSTTTDNFYCVPTVDQSYSSTAYFVPVLNPISGGDYQAGVDAASGSLTSVSAYGSACGLTLGDDGTVVQAAIGNLIGSYFTVSASGVAPDGVTAVTSGQVISPTVTSSGGYEWTVINDPLAGGDLSSLALPLYGGRVEVVFAPEQAPPSSLWRFDAITSTEIIDEALRGTGFSGVPQAQFVEAGVDNVNRLYEDSQRYFNPFGFIAYYGPYILNASGQYIPPTPYVTGVAVRRYRSEGYQFPPAGVKYQLVDAVGTQIAINSAQQNLLNPDGCNAVRTLPNYPSTAVFIWAGRTRVNTADAQQKLYQFVNTRVILNIVYGSLRGAFDSQIFNVIDGFGIAYNKIISIGNSILNQLYIKGALFGKNPSDAFQVICDDRINSPENLEDGIINAKIFVTPVPTLERIQIDLIRVAIGQMQNELNSQGLGSGTI